MFNLSHVTLYSRGWYNRTDNVWEDLMEILKLDGYTPFTYNDVYNILIGAFQKIEGERFNELREVLIGIIPTECWKIGYIHNGNKGHWSKIEGNFKDYDMQTAVIYYILSSIRFMDNLNWKKVTPKYSKDNRKPKHISTQYLIEVFNNKN
jgi:hypothetical protein